MTSKESTHGVVKSIDNSTLDTNVNVNVICEDTILNNLEVLEILKNHLFIRIEDVRDEIYAVILQENEEPQLGYTCIFVSKEEKEIIKEWLEENKNADR